MPDPARATARSFEPTRARLRQLKAFWLDVAKERLEADHEGTFGFNLFACSAEDLVALRELYLTYFQQMQSLIACSRPSECVALFSTQIVRLDRAHRVDDHVPSPRGR
jgi:hypothetical protein